MSPKGRRKPRRRKRARRPPEARPSRARGPKPTRDAGPRSRRWLEILLLSALAALTFVIYSNALDGPFVWDDIEFVQDNIHIRLTELTLTGLKRAAFESPDYRRPVANVTLALNYYFHQYRTAGYRLVNVLTHILTGIFLYFFVKSTLGLASCLRPRTRTC